MANGIATFSVLAADQTYNFTRYRPFLFVDGYIGSTGLSPSMNFTANGTECQVNLTDMDGSGSLKAGNVFRVMSATYRPLPAGHFWTFLLEWPYDGSFVGWVS